MRKRWSLGRGTRPATELLAELEEREASRSTGRLALTEPVPASLYLYRGCAYSARIDGWQPDVIARLVVMGTLTEAQARTLREGAPGDRVRQARNAVEEGLVSVDELATIHLEYLLSAVGALRSVYEGSTFIDGETTDERCALPVEVEPLRETLRLRDERLRATRESLGATMGPGHLAIAPTGNPVPPEYDLPQVRGVLSLLSQPLSVDELAHRAGLTRAESLHVAASLVLGGVLATAKGAQPKPPRGTLWVAEQVDDVVAGP